MLDKVLNNRYKIIKELGKGGMAIVYEANDLLLDRKVALKMLRPEYVNDKEFVSKFRHEAKAVARLSHPHVVNIFDIGQDGQYQYLVMEDIEGRNLKDLIKERGRLSITESLDIANQICAALVVAHRNNIIHCDIKPHNVLITPDKQVKVTDFGIARAVTSATMTLTNTVVGSAHYFAPEQARGGEIKTHSDLYSLGIVLYEMLTGEVPFKGESPISVALKHIQEEPRRPTELNPEIPSPVDELVMKAIAKEPDERFENAEEMRETITRILKSLNRIKKPENLDPEDTKVLKRINLPEKEDKNDNTGEKRYLTESESRSELSRGLRWGIGIALIFIMILVGALFFYQNYMDVPVVEVPDLVGMDFSEAEKVAAQNGLQLEKQNEGVHHPEIPEGSIISQYPTGGERVRQTREILVTLSKGPAVLTAPDLANLTLREAEVILSNNNLQVGEKNYEYSDEVTTGKIIRQDPPPDTEVRTEALINLVISQGKEPAMITMPNLVGLQRDEGERRLKERGLKPGEIKQEKTRRFKYNQISRQQYQPGAVLAENSTVDLTVSLGLINTTDAEEYSVIVRDVFIESKPAKQQIKVVVIDNNGRDVVYNQLHHPSDTWQPLTINSVGPTTYEFYNNGKLIDRKHVGEEG